LLLANIVALNIAFPIVPRGESRVRFVFHAHNTKEQVDATVTAICDWAREMLDIENGQSESSLPSAARYVFARQATLS
jgi:8-amino-7-oxononanoate synthase